MYLTDHVIQKPQSRSGKKTKATMKIFGFFQAHDTLNQQVSLTF